MNKLSPNGKLLAAVALGPIVADFLSDAYDEGLLSVEVNQKHVKNLIYKLRKFDEFLIDTADQDAREQQIDIQRSFRQWIAFNFSEEKECDICSTDMQGNCFICGKNKQLP
jgi:hypothetical protein